ncbi:MAG TPA: DNA-formamidopyrimidine glycosylase family protein [Solirubrobacteraceae bacterium]|nr:DNA-formamidopyrimidine glycosylase family protein [Solirubrobacteraceae bacterium]
MPEGDTIHIAAARIRETLAGRAPDAIRTPHPRLRAAAWPERLAGRRVAAVDAHGKHLFIRFEGGLTIHSHLRMTGAWRIYGAGEPWRRSRGSAWLVIERAGRQAVQFGGPVLELAEDGRLRADPRIAALGPDVLAEHFDEGAFLRRLRADDPRRPFGDALLEQRTVAGIGNVWKSESCHAAGVDPCRPVAAVSDGEALAAIAFARSEMARCVREGILTRPRAVYRRTGRPCPRCGGRISAGAQWENGRVTYWCPACQR